MSQIQLPEPSYPMLTRMISQPLLSEGERGDPVVWIMGDAHPLVPDMHVVRMFVVENGVEVYSVAADPRKGGTRNLIPMARIRLIEEAMPVSVFVEELATAEAGGGDLDDDEGDDEDDVPPAPAHEDPSQNRVAAPPAAHAPNGSPAS